MVLELILVGASFVSGYAMRRRPKQPPQRELQCAAFDERYTIGSRRCAAKSDPRCVAENCTHHCSKLCGKRCE